MSTRTNAMTHFSSFLEGALVMEETKGRLGKVFHTAVITLIAENEGKTGKELAGIFTDTLKELANTHVEKLGGMSVHEALPSFKQYLSDYKRCLELCAVSDIRKCGGVADIKKLLTDTRQAMKEKEEGAHPDDTRSPTENAGASGGAPANDSGVSSKLPESVRTRLNNAMLALEKLDPAEAESIVEKFEGIAWSAARKVGTKRGKVAAAANGGNSAKSA